MISIALFSIFTLVLGLPSRPIDIVAKEVAPSTGLWQPKVGSRFQISLSRRLDSSRSPFSRKPALPVPGSADVFDLDLFDTPASAIQQLHSQGKKVICYFSAGSSESWRKDLTKLNASDMGEPLRGWPNERWLDLRREDVYNVTKARIKLAYEKGCDGIDADNIDAYADEGKRGGGFPTPLKAQDSIAFVQRMAAEAHQHGLSVGLKNAEGILPRISNMVEFAVNEQCATYSGCKAYEAFINSGKAVFHIEYADYKIKNGTQIELVAEAGESVGGMTSEQLHSLYCLQTSIGNRRSVSQNTGKKFSTVIKKMDLSSWVMYCDGSWEGGKATGTRTRAFETEGSIEGPE